MPAMLDHFDGFLSGLYRKYGFTDIYEVYQWEEQYRPDAWTYDTVDVFNEKTSIYSEAMKSLLDGSSNPQGALPNEEIDCVPVCERDELRKDVGNGGGAGGAALAGCTRRCRGD